MDKMTRTMKFFVESRWGLRGNLERLSSIDSPRDGWDSPQPPLQQAPISPKNVRSLPASGQPSPNVPFTAMSSQHSVADLKSSRLVVSKEVCWVERIHDASWIPAVFL